MHILRRPVWFVTLLLTVVAMATVVILLFLSRNTAEAASLTAAQQRWTQQGMQQYQLRLVQESNGVTCEQELLVDNERNGIIESASCGQSTGWTVSRLFTWIGELQRSSANCYPTQGMCACRASIRTVVVYDEQLGYPRRILYEWRKLPNLTSADYYVSLFDQTFPGCDKDGTGGPVTLDVTLSPVQ